MFTFKAADAKKLQNIYGTQRVREVSRRAIRDAAKKGRTAISRETRRIYAVSASDVRERSFVTYDRGDITQSAVIYRDNRPGLQRFSPRQNSKGVSVKIKKGRGRKTLKGAFQIRKFGPLVWQRLSSEEAASRQYSGRKVKIKVRRTISVPEMVRSVDATKKVIGVVQDTYESRFSHHFERSLGIR